ncbi:mitochondrial ribosomal protein S6 [Cricetulus griseus]
MGAVFTGATPDADVKLFVVVRSEQKLGSVYSSRLPGCRCCHSPEHTLRAAVLTLLAAGLQVAAIAPNGSLKNTLINTQRKNHAQLEERNAGGCVGVKHSTCRKVAKTQLAWRRWFEITPLSALGSASASLKLLRYFLVDFYAPTSSVDSILDHLTRDVDVVRPNVVKHPLTQEVKECGGIVPVPLEEKLYSTKRRKK